MVGDLNLSLDFFQVCSSPHHLCCRRQKFRGRQGATDQPVIPASVFRRPAVVGLAFFLSALLAVMRVTTIRPEAQESVICPILQDRWKSATALEGLGNVFGWPKACAHVGGLQVTK